MIKLSERSSLALIRLPDALAKQCKERFEEMYAHRPVRENTVLVGHDKREVKCNRRVRSYMNTPKFDPAVQKSYMFSGWADRDEVNEPLPEVFQPLLDYVNSEGTVKYNQVVVNFYENGSESIPPHGDCEAGMVPGAPIIILSVNISNA